MTNKPNTFFIIGLPRTRSSWLANFLTYKTSFCFHEAIRLCYKIEDMVPLFESINEPNIGDADCKIVFYLESILKFFPNSKWVLIKRDSAAVVSSLEKRYKFKESHMDINFCNKLNQKLVAFEKKFSPLIFQFDELDNVEVCKEFWEYCIPDSPFPYKRWLQLDVMRIDPIESKMLKYHGKDAKRTVFDYVQYKESI